MWQGTILAIYTAPLAGAPMEQHRSVQALAGRGLAGDRYARGVGFYSWFSGPIRELSLIEAEVLERLAQDHNLALPPEQTRRNLLTRGVPLGHLIGRTFRIGTVLARGVEICEPCKHLVDVTGNKRVLAPLIHRGGLHAQILTDGTISAGDLVVPTADDEEEGTR